MGIKADKGVWRQGFCCKRHLCMTPYVIAKKFYKLLPWMSYPSINILKNKFFIQIQVIKNHIYAKPSRSQNAIVNETYCWCSGLISSQQSNVEITAYLQWIDMYGTTTCFQIFDHVNYVARTRTIFGSCNFVLRQAKG